MAVLAGDPAPLVQRGERIGHMLQAMGGQDEITGGIGDAGEVGGLAQKLAAGRLASVEAEVPALAQAGLPGGGAAKVHIVDSRGARIDWQDVPALKYAAGTADFQASLALQTAQDRCGQLWLCRPKTMGDEINQSRQRAGPAKVKEQSGDDAAGHGLVDGAKKAGGLHKTGPTESPKTIA